MPTFPKLKTGAVAQYPATRALEFKTDCVRFVDGAEQRYRDSGAALRRWEIDLTHLDETELGAIEQFFITVHGSLSNFEFVDPWDGTSYPKCSLETDSLDLTFTGEMDGATRLVVIEGRD